MIVRPPAAKLTSDNRSGRMLLTRTSGAPIP
jgi:hypothetical protein